MRLIGILLLLLLPTGRLFSAQEPPPKRSPEDIKKILGSKPEAANPRLLKLTLVSSKQDHGPGEHDYPAWQTNWTKLLKKSRAVEVTSAWQWPSAEQFKESDAMLFYFWNHDWSAERYKQIDAFLERGGGLIILHSASIADKEPEVLAKRIGLAFQPGRSKYRHGALDLKIIAPADNPIMRDLPRKIHFVDETYWPMFGDPKEVELLATTEEEGRPWPMIWTVQKGKGRVFTSILGHYSWTFEDPLFRIMVLRALAWSTSEPIRRFELLASE